MFQSGQWTEGSVTEPNTRPKLNGTLAPTFKEGAKKHGTMHVAAK